MPLHRFAFALVLLSSAALAFPGNNVALTQSMLTFLYQPNEAPGTACTHRLVNAPSQDWEVLCGNRRYTVHLWVTGYEHAVPPKLSYEVLYWVSDHKSSETTYRSTTVWFHLRDKTALDGVDLSLGVDDDTASLRLGVRPPVPPKR